MQKKVRV